MAKKLSIDELRQGRREEEARKLVLEDELSRATDERERTRLQGAVYDTEDRIRDFERDIRALEEAEQSARNSKHWIEDQKTVSAIMESHDMGYLVQDQRIIYCKDFGAKQNNALFKDFTATGRKIVRWFETVCGYKLRGADEDRIIDLFIEQKRSYLNTTASFNIDKWNERNSYNKMSIIKKYWLQPSDSAEYDERFDFLMYCLGGGKAENIEHLERWVLMKYIQPELASAIPNIDLGGGAGGTGKNTFITLLKTVFTPMCVVQAHKEELHKFNGNWEMALILYYDEPEERELEASKLKQATGSEDMRVERKGIDATMADRNYNFLFLSNNPKGVVTLSGGADSAEDRRYSVIYTSTVMLEEARRRGIENAKEYVDSIWSDLVKNRILVSNWLSGLIIRHQQHLGTKLNALHGEDYHNRFDVQKDDITHAFDEILPVYQSQGVIPKKWLADLVRTHTENASWKDKNVVKKFEEYLKRNMIDYEIAERYHIDIDDGEISSTQVSCFRDPDRAGKPVFEWNLICNRDYDIYRSNVGTPLQIQKHPTNIVSIRDKFKKLKETQDR